MLHGCEHYRRRCSLVAPCCGEEAFVCRHCHNELKCEREQDEEKKHQLIRRDVREVVCLLCNTRQPVARECNTCAVEFGAYYCDKCQFYDDDVSRRQFHCDKCGICRVGGAENFFHCDRCGCCYSTSLRADHKCVEQSMHRSCPICLDYLFDSIKPISVLVRCGHAMHEACLQQLHDNGMLRCPLCNESTVDQSVTWGQFDAEVANNPLPPALQGLRSRILCRECRKEQTVPYHFLALKCGDPSCASYNTQFLDMVSNDAVVQS